MSEEQLVRGVHIVPLRDFIHASYDEDLRTRIYDSFAPETREVLASVKTDDWHSVDLVSDMNRGIFEAQADPTRGYEEITRAGGAVAEYGVNTFMRLLIKLMTPEMLAKKWPTIWTKSHNFGSMQAEVAGDVVRKLTLHLSDVGRYHYIGPTAVGFLTFSLQAMGKKEARVIERKRDEGNYTRDSYAFDITW